MPDLDALLEDFDEFDESELTELISRLDEALDEHSDAESGERVLCPHRIGFEAAE